MCENLVEFQAGILLFSPLEIPIFTNGKQPTLHYPHLGQGSVARPALNQVGLPAQAASGVSGMKQEIRCY